MHPMYRGGYSPSMYGGFPHNLNVNFRKDQRGEKMSEERVEVKNIFQGGEPGRGGGDGIGGLGAAAMVAALGGRNQANLGGYGGDGFGFGGGGLGALLAFALLGNRGFGDRGFVDHGHGRDGCCEQLGQQVILSKLGSIEGAAPLAAANVENAICEQTNALQGTLGTLALGMQTGFANTKDSVQASTGILAASIAGTKDAIQNGLFLTNTNLLEGICSVKTAVDAQGDRILSALQNRWTAEDQAKIVAQANEITELRQDNRRRADHDELRIQISNTNTAVAAQAQAQGQFQVQKLGEDVGRLHDAIRGVFQIAQASANQTSIIAGNLGAVVGGAQTATQTPINNRA